MSTETTNKKIKIDNGTTFGRTYTDKAVDELLKNVGGGGKPLLDIFPYLDLNTQTISQEGFDLLSQKLFNNEIVGIRAGEEGMCMLFNEISKESFSFLAPTIQSEIGYIRVKLSINFDLSVKTEYIPSYNELTLSTTTPTSQLIPSITTTNTQQNLTIGNGLEIKDGALQATSSSFNIFDNAFSIGVAENINEETLTLTEVGLNKINSMFTNGKLLGLCFEDPANITTDFTFIPFVSFTGDNYWFTGTTYIAGTNLQFTQIKINKTTGVVEMVQKLIATTDSGGINYEEV